MRYFRPKSFGWWGGVGLIVSGILLAVFPDQEQLGMFGSLLGLLTGGGEAASPAFLVFTGMGIIGIRDKQERDAKPAPETDPWDVA
jgi:drug/metabolite transporter (DMT)-like permease